MIGKIRGILLEKHPPQLVVDVHGLGYEIDAPMSTFYQLPEVGTEVNLLTHFVVREDAQLLYGFYSKEERHLFRALLKVNGVGPRMALTILSSTSPEQFMQSVLNNDTDSLVRLPGIGKKTSERLVIEMRDKLSEWHQAPLPGSAQMSANMQPKRHRVLQDAISALIALGYKSGEANRVVTKIDDSQADSEGLIRRALKELVT